MLNRGFCDGLSGVLDGSFGVADDGQIIPTHLCGPEKNMFVIIIYLISKTPL